MGDINASRIKPVLLYWGAMSMEQATYFLERFYGTENAQNKIDYLCRSRYLTHLRGNPNIVSISDYPGIIFNEEKERCLWVYFEYAKAILNESGNWPKIVTHNDYYGVNFCYNKEYYSIVYVGSDDFTYYNILKTKYDEATTFIYVTDCKQNAEKIRKVNTKDKIWYVQKIGNNWDIVQYTGKVNG